MRNVHTRRGAAATGFRTALLVLAVGAGSGAPSLAQVPLTYRFGPQRPDLVRYNRVEGLSVGARVQVRPHVAGAPISFTGTVRGALAAGEVSARLDATHATVSRRISLSGYHEVAAIEPAARHFGIANSVLALVAGRDDGDYYRRSGASLEVTPPTGRPRWIRVRAHVEHHESLTNQTDFALAKLGDDGWSFRPNLAASDGWEYGGSVELTPRWGLDRNETRGGLDVLVGGAAGVGEHIRFATGGEAHIAIVRHLQLRLEARVGSSVGEPSAQRLWYVGGPLTLRAHAPRTLGGTAFGRGRAELVRHFAFGSLAAFWDTAWAGDRADVRLEDALHAVGGSLSLIDSILRVDAGWALDGEGDFRLDIYLDQLL